MNTLPKVANNTSKTWFSLLLLIIAVILIRGFILFRTDLLGGVNGMYYPVQVRSLLEEGNLAFPDFPLTFYLQAFVARLLNLIFTFSLERSVITASKLVTAILPAMTAIPVFFLAKQVLANTKGDKYIPLVIAAFSTLYIFSLVAMTDMQKTNIGLVWAMFFFYFIYKILENCKVKYLLAAGLFLALAGLTHVGSFGLSIVFLFLIIFFTFIFDKKKRVGLFKLFPIILLILFSIGLSILVFDPERLHRLIGVFLFTEGVFKDNLFSIGKGDHSAFMQLPPAFLPDIFVVFSSIVFFRKRHFVTSLDKIFFLSTIFLLFILGFPLLGLEWLGRLSIMTYIPISMMLIFVLKYIWTDWKREILIAGIFVIITLFPLALIVFRVQKWCVSKEAYEDLYNIKEVIQNTDNPLIVTRHGLEWWSAWILETDIAQVNMLTEATFDEYDVFYLVQIKGKEDVGPGPGSSQFPEVYIPHGAEIVYQSKYFILAKVERR